VKEKALKIKNVWTRHNLKLPKSCILRTTYIR
jgi:hypothetical protein